MQVVSGLVVPREGGALLDSPLVVSGPTSPGVLLRAKDPLTEAAQQFRRQVKATPPDQMVKCLVNIIWFREKAPEMEGTADSE